jgi:hypothetical protein
MATRRDVEQAVLWSNLRPLARLVLLVLLSKADNATAVVPMEHTPSLSTLVAATGMARSAVAEQLNLLEELGWVTRTRPSSPSRKARTGYALEVGKADPERPPARDADASTSPPGGPVHQSSSRTSPQGGPDGTSPQGGPDDVSAGHEESATRTSPPHGHASKKSSTNSSSSKKKPKPDRRDDVETVCRHLSTKRKALGCKNNINVTETWREAARLLIDVDGRKVDQILKAIDWALESDFWRPNIKSMGALRRHYDTMRLQAHSERNQQQRPNRPGGQSRYQPRQNPEDQSAYDEAFPGVERTA